MPGQAHGIPAIIVPQPQFSHSIHCYMKTITTFVLLVLTAGLIVLGNGWHAQPAGSKTTKYDTPSGPLCCSCDDTIPGTMAVHWIEEWDHFVDSTKEINWPKMGFVISDQVFQSNLPYTDSLPTLRVYFGMADSTDLISLTFVQVDAFCNNFIPDTNALFTIDANHLDGYRISKSKAMKRINSWYRAFGPDQIFEQFEPVSAYNFKSKHFDQDTGKIWVDIGVHESRVQPGRYMHHIMFDNFNPDDPKRSNAEPFDFAMPCPRFCGTQNRLDPFEFGVEGSPAHSSHADLSSIRRK